MSARAAFVTLGFRVAVVPLVAVLAPAAPPPLFGAVPRTVAARPRPRPRLTVPSALEGMCQQGQSSAKKALSSIPLDRWFLAFGHQRPTIHEEAVFTRGGLLFPQELTVVDKGIVFVVLIRLLLLLDGLLAFHGAASFRTAHFHVTLAFGKVDAHFVGRAGTGAFLQGSTGCCDSGETLPLRCEPGMKGVEAVAFLREPSEIDILVGFAIHGDVENDGRCGMIRRRRREVAGTAEECTREQSVAWRK